MEAGRGGAGGGGATAREARAIGSGVGGGGGAAAFVGVGSGSGATLEARLGDALLEDPEEADLVEPGFEAFDDAVLLAAGGAGVRRTEEGIFSF